MREKLVLSKEGLQFSKVVLDWFWLAGESTLAVQTTGKLRGELRVAAQEFPCQVIPSGGPPSSETNLASTALNRSRRGGNQRHPYRLSSEPRIVRRLVKELASSFGLHGGGGMPRSLSLRVERGTLYRMGRSRRLVSFVVRS